MPDLAGMSEREALNTLSELGLAVRPIAYRHDPERADTVVRQSLPAGEPVSVDAVVNLEVAVELTAPVVTAPTGVLFVPAGEPMPTLEWDPGNSPVRAWRVTLFLEVCTLDFAKDNSTLVYNYCYFSDRMSIDPDGPGNDVVGFEPERQITVDVEETRYTPAPTFQPLTVPLGRRHHTGWVGWQVQALDDFDNPGPATELMVFRVGTHQP